MSKKSTKVDTESNDSSIPIMSPALTNDHCQDVGTADDETAKDIKALSKILSGKGSWAKESGNNDSFSTNFFQENNADNSTSNSKASLRDLTATSISNQDKDGCLVETCGLQDNSNEKTGYNDRILHKHNGLTKSEPVDSKDVSSYQNGLAPVNGSNSTAENGCFQKGSTSPCTAEVPTTIPTCDILSQRLELLETRATTQQHRANNLLSMVASRHVKQQLMLLVEHQHKLLQERHQLHHMDKQQLLAANCVGLSSSGELSSMSTSALVNLVHRIQTENSGKLSQASTSSMSKASITMSQSDRSQLQDASGITTKNLTCIQKDIDSDATASSSGGETDDEETLLGSNIKLLTDRVSQHPGASDRRKEICKKPCWRWSKDRAMVISRWTWLQAQVSDLEYKIRQLGELHRQLRSAKSTLIPFPNAHQGPDDPSLRAARCFPLPPGGNRHKFVRVSEAPSMNSKARKEVLVRCQCGHAKRHCAICAGHHNYFKPVDIFKYPRNERLGLVNEGFHPVLSFSRDLHPCVEIEEVVNSTDKKHSTTAASALSKKLLKKTKKELALDNSKGGNKGERLTKYKNKKKLKLKRRLESSRQSNIHPSVLNEFNDDFKPKKRKYTKRNNKATSAHRQRTNSAVHWSDEELSAGENCISMSASVNETKQSSHKRSTQSYDIDDIVIPYHIAASTRVEKLQYKEIDTPRWRECLVDGNNTIYDTLRSSTSVPSTPLTPMTPMEPTIPHVSSQTSMASVESAPTVMNEMPSLSSKSSTNSLAELEGEEDLSDEKYLERHSKLEEKEKTRYQNFVTGTGTNRRRTNSSRGSIAPAEINTTTPAAAPACNNLQQDLTVKKPLVSTPSFPLSASCDSVQLKDELAYTARRRSNSIAGKVKRDISVDVQEQPVIHPWVLREFPLQGDDVEALDPDWKPPVPELDTGVLSPTNRNTEQWKVIGKEEAEEAERGHLVLKLSKTS